MKITKNRLRQIIREEVGRNLQSDKTKPFNFKDYNGYEVEVVGGLEFGWTVSVKYNGEDVANITNIPTEEEANHYARMVVDKDRIKRDLTV